MCFSSPASLPLKPRPYQSLTPQRGCVMGTSNITYLQSSSWSFPRTCSTSNFFHLNYGSFDLLFTAAKTLEPSYCSFTHMSCLVYREILYSSPSKRSQNLSTSHQLRATAHLLGPGLPQGLPLVFLSPSSSTLHLSSAWRQARLFKNKSAIMSLFFANPEIAPCFTM